jgi:hypothetical protein
MDGTRAVIQVTMLGIGEGECQNCGREFVCILSLAHYIFCVGVFSFGI